jgi:hypothetical protein
MIPASPTCCQGQSDRQGIELLARVSETSAPDSEAVMDEHLHPIAVSIGQEGGMVGTG